MRRRRVWPPLAAVLVIAVVIVFFTNIPGISVLPFLPKIRIQRSETTASSVVTLQSVRDLYAFNTVEYIHRAVFPYDYLPQDVSITGILQKLRTATGTVQETLTPEEYLYFQTYNLAMEIGMSLTGRAEFVVVTVVLTAGFDLREWMNAEGAEVFRAETVTGETGEVRRAIVAPPPAAITDVVVEDISADNYPYPDIAVSAEAWRRIAGFVEERAREIPQIPMLLATAARNGREFVAEVLRQAGYDEVVFTNGMEM